MANKWSVKRRFAAAGCILFGIMALVSGSVLLLDNQSQRAADEEFENLRGTISVVVPAVGESITPAAVPQSPIEKYGSLAKKNPDFAGWVQIEGTSISYPVMFTPKEPDFYLNHDFQRKNSSYGVPYADSRSDFTKGNVLLYGHHTKNKGIFGALVAYEDKAFYQSHPVIQFDTLKHYGEYQIAMVVKTTALLNNPDAFDYTQAAFPSNQAEFNRFLSMCETHEVYKTGEKIAFGDSLLLLSTCEYSREDGRLLIVAKQVKIADLK